MIVLPSGVINDDDDDDNRMEVFFYLKRAFNWARLKLSIMLFMTQQLNCRSLQSNEVCVRRRSHNAISSRETFWSLECL